MVLLADGFVGQMMEPVDFSQAAVSPEVPAWAVDGTAQSRGNLITSLHMENNDLEAHLLKLEEKYKSAERNEVLAEEFLAEDAEIVLVGFGIVARILKAVTAEARAEGVPVGVLRPITLFPFPALHLERLARRARVFVVVEMSNGQLIDDVRLALNGSRPVEFLRRMGGNVPSHEEVLEFVRKLARQIQPESHAEKEWMVHV